ncbi:4-hydroxythreonine-4-phosphate dehydrogenase PdxA, partial [Ralstonia pseudosolanacearum]
MLNIAITTGEPAGIGPDITVTALLRLLRQPAPRHADVRWHVIGDAALLQARADAIGLGDAWRDA